MLLSRSGPRARVIFTADRLWPRNSSFAAVSVSVAAVIAQVRRAEAGPYRAVGILLGALQVALGSHVDGIVCRAVEWEAPREALSKCTWTGGQGAGGGIKQPISSSLIGRLFTPMGCCTAQNSYYSPRFVSEIFQV